MLLLMSRSAHMFSADCCLPAVAKDDAVGLRIDLELEDPATGETK